MILFPPATAVTVVLDGAPIRTYQPAVIFAGRTYAPIQPFLTRVADRLWCEGSHLIVRRGGREVRVRLTGNVPRVPLAPVMRALGARVSYRNHLVLVTFERARPIATPTPFDPSVPTSAPRSVFTPAPVATPRPVWSGAPLPRRTPLPVTEPTP